MYEAGQGVTFKEFILYLLKSYKSRNDLESPDQHWRLPRSLCYPCQMKYDFIGKMETLIEDSRYIMKKWRIGNEDLFPAEGGRSYSIETKI